jgi:hypothetical protein
MIILWLNIKNTHIKVKIICKEHGIFEQTPHDHLTAHGCKKCFKNRVCINN